MIARGAQREGRQDAWGHSAREWLVDCGERLSRLVRAFGARRRPLLRAALVLAAVSAIVLFHISDVESVMQNGDSAVYNQQVEDLDIRSRSSHVGYFLFGIVLQFLIPAGTDWVMNFGTVLLGSAGAVAVFFTAYRFTKAWVASAIAALSLLALPAYVRGMLLSEVDVPLASLVAIAFALWIHRRSSVAGIVFGFAMLVSPLGALWLVAFLLAVESGPTLRSVLREHAWRVFKFGVCSLLVFLPLVLYNFDDWFWGGRGIMGAPRLKLDLGAQWDRSTAFFSAQASILLPFHAAGALIAIAKRQCRLVVPVLAAAAIAVAGDRLYDVPVQLPGLVLFAPLVGVAVATGRWWIRFPISGLAALAVVSLATNVRAEQRDRVARLVLERDRYHAMLDGSRRPVVLVNHSGSFNIRRTERILSGVTYSGRVLRVRDFRRQCPKLARGPSSVLWFLGPPFKAPCGALQRRYRLRQKAALGKRYRVLTE